MENLVFPLMTVFGCLATILSFKKINENVIFFTMLIFTSAVAFVGLTGVVGAGIEFIAK